MRAENQPVASEGGGTKPEESVPSDHTPQSRGRVGSTSSIIRKLMEKVVKPKQPQTIHSGTISEEERHTTLAPFAMPGISIEKVSRDYEAFFKSAWDSPSPSSSSKSSAAATPQAQTPAFSALVQQHPQHAQAQAADADHKVPQQSRRERKTDQSPKSQRQGNVSGGRLRAFTADDDLGDGRGGGGGGSRSPPRSPQLRKARQLIAPEVCLSCFE